MHYLSASHLSIILTNQTVSVDLSSAAIAEIHPGTKKSLTAFSIEASALSIVFSATVEDRNVVFFLNVLH